MVDKPINSLEELAPLTQKEFGSLVLVAPLTTFGGDPFARRGGTEV